MFGRALFQDRRDAGRQLAERLDNYRGKDVVIIGLPRGGVEVAYEVAGYLEAPLDVIVARKIGAPQQPELGIGAVAPGGVVLLDDYIISQIGLSEPEIRKAAHDAETEMKRRLVEYRGGDEMPDLSGKTVIIVDDGLATGVTARAAVQAAKRANAAAIVLAIPVCAPETAAEMEDEVDAIICVERPEIFMAVGLWYSNFGQTTDAQVIELLEEARDEVSPEDISEL